HLVEIAVDEANRRLSGLFGAETRRRDQRARERDDAERRLGQRQTDIERHHGALAEADEERLRRPEFGARPDVTKALEHSGSGHGNTLCDALDHVVEVDRKPLVAEGILSAAGGRVWREEQGVGEEFGPVLAEADEVLAIGAVAVEDEDELVWRVARARGKSGA